MPKQMEWNQQALAHAVDRAAAMHDRMKRLSYPYNLVLEDDRKVVIEREPEVLRDKVGELTAIDAWVRVYRPDGTEIPVDPHRVMSNMPANAKDPSEIFFRNVRDSIVQAPNPRGWKTKGTVSQFFDAPSPAFISSTNGTYATARTGGTLATGGVTSSLIGQDTGFVCYEAFLNFATGATIPDADVVTVVTLDLPMFSYSGTAYTINVREKVFSGGGLTTADWVSGASLSGLTLVASRSTSGFATLPTLTTWTSQAAFLVTPNLKTGNVELILTSSRHEAGNSPSASEITSFDIDTSAARLTVTHNSAGSRPTFQTKPNRIWRRR